MKRFIQYLLAVLTGGAFALLIFGLKGLFAGPERQQAFRILSDGFLSAGIILLACGALVWLSGAGAFDGLRFAFRSLFVAMHKREYRESHRVSYSEYKENKHSQNKSVRFLFIVAGGYLILAIIFTVLFFV